MVNITIKYKNNRIKQLTVSGHANSGAYGQDLVCAAISGIVGGALNAIDIYYKDQTNIEVLENQITIDVDNDSNEHLQTMLNMLKVQLHTITVQYPKNSKLKEVC